MVNIELNSIIEVKVDKVEDNLIKISYKGLKGIIQVVDVSWDINASYKELIHNNEYVKVKVVDIICDTKNNITFKGSIKHIDENKDPWIKCGKLCKGDKLNAKIISKAPYGYFCSLFEFNYTFVEGSGELDLTIGSSYSVEVVNVDKEKKRVTVKIVK